MSKIDIKRLFEVSLEVPMMRVESSLNLYSLFGFKAKLMKILSI